MLINFSMKKKKKTNVSKSLCCNTKMNHFNYLDLLFLIKSFFYNNLI